MKWRAFPLLILISCLHFGLGRAADWKLSPAEPETIGLLSSQLGYIEEAVAAAIQDKEIPGAVVLVARHGKIGYFKAFGHRVLEPQPEIMTTSTIFDMASLTKVMATSPAVLLLVERGKIRLGDRVKRYLPEFTGGGKDAITVRNLITHFSGLRPDFDLSIPWEGYSATLEELWKETARGDPGKEFVYSDLNFITLGEIVNRVSAMNLADFARANIYAPLGMDETRFTPPAELWPRIAPTETRARSVEYLQGKGTPAAQSQVLRGSVHDPTAWRMGGVAGHAGLFSSAMDVAVYAQTLLNGGVYRGKRIFSPAGVQAMTTAQSPKSSVTARGFGWDIDSSFSVPRGDLLAGGFGHTGFTGTSLWVAPSQDLFVVLLTSRLYPEGKGDVTHLRGAIANIVAASIADPR